jgi:hypothetical protein
VIAALASLAKEGLVAREVVANAIERYGVNSSAPPPWTIGRKNEALRSISRSKWRVIWVPPSAPERHLLPYVEHRLIWIEL